MSVNTQDELLRVKFAIEAQCGWPLIFLGFLPEGDGKKLHAIVGRIAANFAQFPQEFEDYKISYETMAPMVLRP